MEELLRRRDELYQKRDMLIMEEKLGKARTKYGKSYIHNNCYINSKLGDKLLFTLDLGSTGILIVMCDQRLYEFSPSIGDIIPNEITDVCSFIEERVKRDKEFSKDTIAKLKEDINTCKILQLII